MRTGGNNRIGRRTARTIRQNLAFSVVYNLIDFSLGALGIRSPVWAAAAQRQPDVAIILNSVRLLRMKAVEEERSEYAPGVFVTV